MNKTSDFIIKNISPYRAWLAAPWKGADIDRFVQTIKAYTESPEREILLDSRNRVVRGEIRSGQSDKLTSIVIKQFRKLKPYDTARFTLIRSKALRSFLNAIALQSNGILTPEPVLCVEKRDGAFLLESYYVCRYVDVDFSLHEMFRDERHKPWENILALLASEIRKIHQAGILYGDLNGANILLKITDGPARFYFIDLNRMKHRGKKKMTYSAIAFELSWLGIPPQYRDFFLEAYTGKTDSTVHHAYLFALKYRRRVDALKKVRQLWRPKNKP